MKAEYLICYDISSPKRLAKIFRYLKARARHMQYSVFHCSMTWPELQAMENDIANIINEKKDDVRIYPLPSGGKVISMGCGDRLPEGVDMYE